ncbi:NAD(P)H-binding protein [Nesterenkonia lutea]|uniref:Nucleoside-diphosphate-sugar epimerase n=1 Tax=Nesterenkonia lutea TaxID=272919 RepID=A0ABR9JAD9_9MICC|nr:NAD(P)H-binding protein [Nesterenkonia lutea]MBE1522894.1 nucleoside-diphosphate-sugar epimerase [Nesterenkonia lutea]
MAESQRVVILGGHGKIALLAAPKLVAAGFTVESVIRNPDQSADVAEAGAAPRVLDIESAETSEMAEAFAGAHAVVFAAGAGGGDPARTKAVDQEAAVRSMDAAVQAGVSRYVMVSYARSQTDIETVDPKSSFYPYALAKHQADNHLRASALDFTILGPGALTLEPASEKITVLDPATAGEVMSAEGASVDTSRENVAEVITETLRSGSAVRATVNFLDGETPIQEALASVSS